MFKLFAIFGVMFLLTGTINAQAGTINGGTYAPMAGSSTFSNGQLIYFTSGEPLRPNTDDLSNSSSTILGINGIVSGILYVSILTLPADPSFDIQVFPNPFEQYLSIVNTGTFKTSGFKAQIYNSSGERITEFIIKNTENFLDLSNLPEGVYILSFFDTNAFKLPQSYKIFKTKS